MPNDTRHRLTLANRELRDFLKRVEGLVQGQSDVGADHLSRIRTLLQSVAVDVRESQRTVCSDPGLATLLGEYAGNLRATQKALEQVQCVMLARRARMNDEQGRLSQLKGWTNAYRQTT